MTRRRFVTALLFPLVFLAASGLGAVVALELLTPRIERAEAEVDELLSRVAACVPVGSGA